MRYSALDLGPDQERHFLALYRIDGPDALASEEFAAHRGFGPFAEHVTFTTRIYARHEPTELGAAS
jgi:hypothetical protein